MGSGMLTLTSTVAAAAPVNTQQMMNIQTSPEKAAVQTQVIPSGQTWIILDLYILVAANFGTSDPQIRFVKNQLNIVAQTGQMSSLLVTNPSRPILSPKLGFEGQSQLEIYIITTVLNDATADAIFALAPIDKRV